VPSWAAMDMFPCDHPLLVGGFGTHGTRYGNFAVQNADLVLAIGARLSTRETGSPLSSWAREAKTIIVDVDHAELGKFPTFDKPLDLPIVADAKTFINALLAKLNSIHVPDIAPWREKVRDWKQRYPIFESGFRDDTAVNPYVFVEELAAATEEGDQFVIDTGCAIAWMMQGFRFKKGQRAYHAFNTTPMGYALPAAIGASLALDGKRIITIAGDGALLMNIQELVTASRHKLPIKLFLMNNNGYSMVQQTQEQWLGGKYHATTVEGGLGFPDFVKLAESCSFGTVIVDKNKDLASAIRRTLDMPGPVLCDVRIPSTQRVRPQSKFGYPIEDAEPLLPRKEFLENMIVAPMEVSTRPLTEESLA